MLCAAKITFNGKLYNYIAEIMMHDVLYLPVSVHVWVRG